MEFLIKIIDVLVALLLSVGSFLGLAMAVLYVLKPTGNRQTNFLFGLLLATLSLTLLDNLFVLTGWFNRFHWLYFLPIYFTFSFGPLLFFFVKSHLYPAFRLARRDFKHFILPVVQIGFFITAFFRHQAVENDIGNQIFFPYYGTFEKPLYLLIFGTYLYFARRFVIHRATQPTDFPWQQQKIFRLRVFIKILAVLFLIHAFFITADYVNYRILGLSLGNVRSFFWFSDVAAAALTYWVIAFGYANEFLAFVEGKMLNMRSGQSPSLVVSELKSKIENEKLFLEPNLQSRMFVNILPVSSARLEKLVVAYEGKTFKELLISYRVAAAKKLLAQKKYQPELGLELGFYSRKFFVRQFKKHTGIPPADFEAENHLN